MYSLCAFPGPVPPELVAGFTPPRDADGGLLDLRPPENVSAEFARSASAAGWPVYWVWQVHGSIVEAVGADTPPGLTGKADALVTDRCGVLLVTRHADCPPVLLYDPRRGAVGLAHSGRKGTLGGVAGAVVRTLSDRYGTDPGDVLAFLGPGIRTCCYEVRSDVVAEAHEARAGDRWFEERGRATYMDLFGLIGAQLRASGVETIYGEGDTECTRCGPSQLHSYRRTGSKTCFAAVAGIRP